METRSMPLENRPRLPRIALSKQNRAVVRALNPMLVTYLEASRDAQGQQQKLTERIDDLKQRIAAWGKRIRRYTERSTRFNQNRLFQSDQKRLYKSLERPMVSETGPVPN
ncbi:unnamed protein product [Parnassius apollo]|uniref:(apollo) hypothetical protein n=1 Tax=Parnassius apollo TaxID=110799 RepID=A0A8S3WRS5_PARAO|nr:unnamed protein product [Parnassius apollo]